MSKIFKFSTQLARGYATAGKSVQVPLTLHGIEGRYATALYTAASKNKTLEAVEADFKKIQSTIEKSEKLKFILEDPTINRDDKKKNIAALLTSFKANETTKNLFDVLIENRRLAETSKIATAFSSLMAAHRGELELVVTSAQPLDNETLKQLKDTLSKSNLAANSKSVTIRNQVKPAILGGLVIEFGDKTIDLSVSSKISKINKALTDTI